MKQEEFNTGMYIVDESYRMVACNDAMRKLYSAVKPGQICYEALALQSEPCAVCPLKTDNALFYNPIRKEWIYANAASMPYPGHGNCYYVQFQIRHRIEDVVTKSMQEDDLDEYIKELSDGNADAAAIGGYAEQGSPLAFANEKLLELLGYKNMESMYADIDGMVFNTIHPDDVERVTRDLTKCAQMGGTFESTYRMRRQDNSWFWVVARGTRVGREDGPPVLLAVITDMSELVKQQDALQEQNRQLAKKNLTSQTLLEHMPGGYHRCAPSEGFPFLYYGSSFEKITGWTAEEIETVFHNNFAEMVLPEDLPTCASIVTEVDEMGHSNKIYRLKRKGGGYTWVSDSTMRVDVGGESYYHGVLADVTNHIEALEQARLKAEAGNKAKSAFLFNASHDFRTPMNAIQGFTRIIEDNAHNPGIVLENIRKLKQSGDILMTLMNDVLELSRIEQGKELVNRRPLDMLVHTDKLKELVWEDMEEKHIRFTMENDIAHPLVMADNLKLTRIAMNLLSNAKKFTPAGGSVSFGVRETDFDGTRATYTLWVQDSGIGMSREFQSRAFEQFERERTATDSGVSGSGLGLSIIKKLTDLLGGTCTIESDLGKGTLITVSVRLEVTDESAFQPELQLNEISFTGKRILLVEDNDFNREIGRYIFEGMGFAVEEAVNGVECLDLLSQHPDGYFDYILMDIQMPIMDGYTATREIRRHPNPAIARIPIIAMTANAFDEDRRKCLEVGMNGHIGKPIDMNRMLEILGTFAPN